ncbi:hypothetical protein Tco_0555511 [Tanacetum coccineum]
MIRLRADAASISHSLSLPPPIILSHTRTNAPSSWTPPLHLLSTDRREDRPKVTLPPRKRLGSIQRRGRYKNSLKALKLVSRLQTHMAELQIPVCDPPKGPHSKSSAEETGTVPRFSVMASYVVQPTKYYGIGTADEEERIPEATEMAIKVIDKRIHTFADHQTENKRKKDNNQQPQQQHQNKRQNTDRAYLNMDC